MPGVELVSIVDTGAHAPHAFSGPDRCTKIARHSADVRLLAADEAGDNAAAVASGDLKPTSTDVISRVEDRLRVIVHISEPVHKYRLSDTEDLRTFVEAESPPVAPVPVLGACRREARAEGIVHGVEEPSGSHPA